jgi:hypothetical protein
MARKILAFIAFNIYSIFLISAFQESTAYLFDTSLINAMRLKGLAINPREWGWGGHYIWRLFSGVVVTGLVATLSGAIAKTNGNKIAALANIPSVIVWLVMIYLFGFTNVEVEGKAGFIVISILAVPLTTYVAYVFGRIGKELQEGSFPENTVLGIKDYHWVWGILPIYWYMLGIVFVATKFIAYQFASWSDMSIFSALVSLFMLIPIIAWGYPLLTVHRVLAGNLLSSRGVAVRGFAIFGILVAGMILATGIQFGDYWLLSKILK